MGDLTFRALDPSTWPDLIELFQTHDNPRSCWCQFWRLSVAEWKASDREAKRARLTDAVDRQQPLGVLAYRDGTAVGWCSVGPRQGHARVERARSIPAAVAAHTWSVTCFFVRRGHRAQGLTEALLREAIASARAKGARVVEGYPVIRPLRPDGTPIGAPFRFMGDPSIYRRAGFVDVAPSGQARRLMRLEL